MWPGNEAWEWGLGMGPGMGAGNRTWEWDLRMGSGNGAVTHHIHCWQNCVVISFTFPAKAESKDHSCISTHLVLCHCTEIRRYKGVG